MATVGEQLTAGKSIQSARAGMAVPRVFSAEGVSPYDQVDWDHRTAAIKDEKGRVIFEQTDCEVPSTWTQLATNVVVSKYFYGEVNTPERESSVRQLVDRVTRTIADWGREDGYFASDGDAQIFYDELTWLCLNQHGAFNSPVWFNVGLFHRYGIEGPANNWRWDEETRTVCKAESAYKYPQGSACFIQSVDDDMESIMELARSEAMLFKFGSGTGTDLSSLRSSREKLSGGGRPSGPVSFMRVYDAVASVVKSGGKCLAPTQGVYTAGGVRTVQELAEAGQDFVVLSYSKRLGRVAAKKAQAFRSGRKEVVALITDKGEFHLSVDHPVMLKTGEMVPIHSLRRGLSLMATSTYAHGSGYVRVGLANGRRGEPGRDLLHRMVAHDVLGFDLDGMSVHHRDENRLDSRPENLEVMSQSEHAGNHGTDAAGRGEHIFQTHRFPHEGTANGMHASAPFWRDRSSADVYRAKQAARLVERGTATEMQVAARRVRMFNTGYKLINAGHDIETFEGYVEARKAAGRRCPSVPGQLKKFDREFGSYAEYYRQLREGNHQVLDVRSLGIMDVYDIEVFDDEPDDKRPWSEHNFAITPIGQPSIFGTHIFVANTRRAAKMQTLKVKHPDILDFIEAKTKEEKKAQALIRAGYEANFNGEAYSSVMFQNANLSVRVTDAFLRAAEAGDDWTTTGVTHGRPMDTFPADLLLAKIAEGTWLCGDPGMQYEDTIQRWHTCPNTAPINSSNPCSEFMFLDDSSCNLSSINLMKFRLEDGTFDAERFRAACRIFITAQEILVDHGSYPTRKIAENSHKFRPLGLGYANLGSLIMASGRPYDSPEGRALAGAITAIMHGEAYRTSAEHAAHLGAFEGFAVNREPMLNVMAMHRDAVEAIDPTCPENLRTVAREVWDDCMALGRQHGYRNSQVTVIAPTGTIAFMMDCDTTGIEPDIALVKYKSLAGGGMLKLVNRIVPMALATLGYDDTEVRDILEYVDAHDTIEGAPGLDDEDLPVFDCAFPPPQGGRSIHWHGHVDMMAAAQPFLSGAISKTVNMPREAAIPDIREAYLEGWRLGLKALAIYRDGSKESQPVNTKSEDARDKEKQAADRKLEAASPLPAPEAADSVAPTPALEAAPARVAPSTPATATAPTRPQPRRERLPETRQSMTHKFDIQGHEGYLTVGFFADGRPGELFITMAKEGSTVGGLMDVIGTLVSMGLQYGVPLDVFVNKFAHSRFEPAGFTKNPEIPIAKSITDYIFRWLGIQFVPGYRAANTPNRGNAPAVSPNPEPLTYPQSNPVEEPILPAPEVKVNGHRKATSDDIDHAEPGPQADLIAEPVYGGPGVQQAQFAQFQSDAPSCDNCGSLTVRCGTCYRCFNCGNSMGCS